MRRDDPFEGLVGDRRGTRWYRDLQAGPRTRVRQLAGMYSTMLVEDASHLFPLGRTGRDAFAVELLVEGQLEERTVLNAVPGIYGPARSLADAVRQFTEDLVPELMVGSIAFEVELFRDEKNSLTPSFLIHNVPNDQFWRHRGRPRQYVPGEFSSKRWRGLSYVDLHPCRVVTADLSKQTRRSLESAFEVLAIVDRLQSAAHSMALAQPSVRGFTFSEHNDLLFRFARKRTRFFGWDGRGLLSEGVLDPYRIWRLLQFARFRVHMRNVLVDVLENCINVAGQDLGFSVSLAVTGVMTERAIAEAETALESGTRSLAELSRFAQGLPAD